MSRAHLTASGDKNSDMTKILGLIPAYNEAAHINKVVTGAQTHLPVLVVDDGSADDTASRAEAAGATVLRQTPNQGKGVALRAGFSWALEAGYEAIITLDADGQHDPAEIPRFLDAYAGHGADLIIGARDFSQMPPIRRLSNTVGGWAFSWAIGQSIRDNQSGYRLISRRLLEAILASDEAGFEFEVEMIVICIQRGFLLDWVPIRTIYAGETSHIHPWHHTVNFLRMVWQTRKRSKQGVGNRE
jgi:glycosyltransferase involved in cell wall biosynthesis